MTPDELPADMEGRLLHYLSERAKMSQIDRNLIHGLNVGDTREAGLTVSDLRALLKAYQEQRRALEPFAKAAALFDTGDYVNHDACIYRPAAGDEYSLNSGHLLAARRALNQKGDER